MPESAHERRQLTRILIAFGVIYFVWGSTFLAIRVAIVNMPPLLMCSVRLVLGGMLMLGWAFVRKHPWPRGAEWRNAALVGILLPAIGNGAVTLGVKHVPSGLVALLVATIPLWMALLSAFGRERTLPSAQAVAGLALGFAGIALLIGPGLLDARRAEFSPWWALVPVAGALSWAWGSLWSRRVRLPSSPLMSTAVGLCAGGALLLALSAAAGEFASFEPARVTAGSLAALLYLAVFGSVFGFTAYLYLLHTVQPAVVSTYAFVNPIVAMAMGWLFAGERLSPRSLLAAAIVVAAVALLTTARGPARAAVAAAALARRP